MTRKNTPVHEDVSVDVVLERRQRSYSCGEPRVNAGRPSVAAPRLRTAEIGQRTKDIVALDADRLAIRKVIESFETLPPDQVQKNHGVLTTDPYTSISDGDSVRVDLNAIKKWEAGSVFGTVSKQFTAPLQFLEMNIVLIDEKTAAATYTIEQGGVFGTSAVVLVKGDKGDWRVSVHCQHPVTG